MTNVIIYIILPCNIFHSFETSLSLDKLIQCAVVFAIAVGAQFLYMVINKVAYNRYPLEQRVVMQYATIVNNASFMGLPVIESVFGSTGILYGFRRTYPNQTVYVDIRAVALYEDGEKQQYRKLATHPCIWAVILGFAYLFSPVRLPAVLSDTIGMVGSSTTLLSMFIVGTILSEVDCRAIFDKACFYYSLIRLIVIPGVIYAVLKLLGIDPVVAGVSVLS
jgi:predicted permease